jgi:hypothetical protein
MSITELEVLDQCISDLILSTQDIKTPRASLINKNIGSLSQLVSFVITTREFVSFLFDRLEN